MSLVNKIKDSKLSLEGNGFNPALTEPAWGFQNPNITAPGLNPLDPKLSILQNTNSVNATPTTRIVSFNKTAYAPYLPNPSELDELDTNAPTNKQAGFAGSVVSQIYKSASGKKYKDLGPKDGRY